MKRIHVLSSGFTSPNSIAFLFPLLVFGKALRARGFDIKILNTLTPETTQCDVLLIDSKWFKASWGQNFTGTIEQIANLNAQTKVIWCDQADSTGTLLGQVIPHVHRYVKAQILEDKTQYLRPHYASRIYTDYYHTRHGIEDLEPYIQQTVQDETLLQKIGVSWNSGLMNYSVYGPLMTRIAPKFLWHFTKRFTPARSVRNVDMTCRMGISYSRNTVCFQRLQMREILKDHLPTDKLSRRKYFAEMERSKICISLFGLGEITLKDFECFLSGALLLKPDMSHMKTWPHFFEDGQTCLFHDWDLERVKERIEWTLHHDAERIKIAQNAQDRYAAHTCGKDAAEIFAQHFQEMVEGRT